MAMKILHCLHPFGVITLNSYSNFITALLFVLEELNDVYCCRVNVLCIVSKCNDYCPKDKNILNQIVLIMETDYDCD